GTDLSSTSDLRRPAQPRPGHSLWVPAMRLRRRLFHPAGAHSIGRAAGAGAWLVLIAYGLAAAGQVVADRLCCSSQCPRTPIVDMWRGIPEWMPVNLVPGNPLAKGGANGSGGGSAPPIEPERCGLARLNADDRRSSDELKHVPPCCVRQGRRMQQRLHRWACHYPDGSSMALSARWPAHAERRVVVSKITEDFEQCRYA